MGKAKGGKGSKGPDKGGKGGGNKVKQLGAFAKKAKRNKRKREGKPQKELTPEEEEERAQRRAERAAQREAEEDRQLTDDSYHEGEVMQRAKAHAWVKPKTLKDLDEGVRTSLKAMNTDFRNKAKERAQDDERAQKSI